MRHQLYFIVLLLAIFCSVNGQSDQGSETDSGSSSSSSEEDQNVISTDYNTDGTSQNADDFMDDNGNFNLTRWEEVMRPCQELNEEDMVQCMNERQQFMKVRKAPRQYPGGALLTEDERTMGGLAAEEPVAGMRIKKEPTPSSVELPASFDVRERWPECRSVFDRIRNQPCNNCWAYSSTSAMADRICITSNATTKVLLSADDLTTCCADCQSVPHQCAQGGYPSKAFKYWISDGIVSEQCKPSHKFTANATQECTQECKNPIKDYSKTKYYGQSYLMLNNATRIQQEILVNGSVEVLFVLLPTLYNYESGIYIPTTTKASNSYHSVRLIGWGELSTTGKPLPYWIGVNSWGRGWGENGTFRVIRGINAGNIEQFAVAGYPRVTAK